VSSGAASAAVTAPAESSGAASAAVTAPAVSSGAASAAVTAPAVSSGAASAAVTAPAVSSGAASAAVPAPFVITVSEDEHPFFIPDHYAMQMSVFRATEEQVRQIACNTQFYTHFVQLYCSRSAHNNTHFILALTMLTGRNIS
jgi:hypothetical protein